MKPFCSGSRKDARLLLALEREAATLEMINPFYFDKPLAPAAAAGRRHVVPLEAALDKINFMAGQCDLLIVEGIGGLMVPLGEDYTVRDLVRRLQCRTIVTCRNRLGVINHAVLTANALQAVGIEDIVIAMMEAGKPDRSAASNPEMIRKMLPPTPVFCLPHLGPRASFPSAAKKNATFLQKTLALIAGGAIVDQVLNKNKRD
jgi:dethiobiotin synthetase